MSLQEFTQFHPDHLMNVEQYKTAANPQIKPNSFGYESALMVLSSTSTITIYY